MSRRETILNQLTRAGSGGVKADDMEPTEAPWPSLRRSIGELRKQGHNIQYVRHLDRYLLVPPTTVN